MRLDRLKKVAPILLACALVGSGAIYLRAVHLDWGVPGHYSINGIPVPALHPDEHGLVEQARWLLDNPLVFPSFLYPPAHAQLTAAVSYATGLRGEADLYFIARSISVVASLFTIPMTFLVGSYWGLTTGWAAALWMALVMGNAREAHWANPDALQTFFIMASLALFLRGRGAAASWCAGALLGAGFCSKYFAAFFLHIPLACLCLPRRDDRARKTWRDALGFYGGFALAVGGLMGLYLARNFPAFLLAWKHHGRWASGTGLYGMYPSPLQPPSYMFSILPAVLGPAAFFLFVGGVVLAVRRARSYLPLLLTPLPFYLFLESIRYHPLRFSLPLVPFACLFAAVLVREVLGVASPAGRKWAAAALVCATALTFLYSLAYMECLDPVRDTRARLDRWADSQSQDRIGVVGVNASANRFDLCRYRHSITFSGERVEWRDCRYVVVPEAFRIVLDQWVEMEEAGYRYSLEDWGFINPPEPRMKTVAKRLRDPSYSRLVATLDNPPHILGAPFEWVHLPLTYLWLSNLKVEIYEVRLGTTGG